MRAAPLQALLQMLGSAALWGTLGACGAPDAVLSAEEHALLETLGPLGPPRRDPTNAVEDDPRAVALGRRLFYDPALSSDGTVSCASCHDPSQGWADPRPLSRGVGGRLGRRHASTLVDAGHNEWQFWDGRADSLWSQPLQAIENPNEMDMTRLEVVRLVARRYASSYEALFGPLPDTASLPPRGRPGDPAWEALDEATQDAVNRLFANVGKAIAAFVRRIECRDTPLDRYLMGDEAALSEAALRGARLFVRDDRGRCIACHSGPNLSDGFFHNLGLHQPTGQLDRGRNEGIEKLLADPFNGAGRYSDDPAWGRQRLRYLEPLPLLEGAFKTPTLRGVVQRAPLGHLGSVERLRGWIAFHERGGGDPSRDRYAGTKEGTLRPIPLTEEEREALLAFLEALRCPPVPLELLPPGEQEP